MGFFISRQRDGLDNCLYIEIVCGGPKHAGKDILPFKYNSDCDGKNLVSPIDAVAAAERIYKRWQLDYHDEEKRLRIIDDKAKHVFEFDAKGLTSAKSWANKVYASMDKCKHCGTILGAKIPFTIDDIPNAVFCCEAHLAVKYRDMFGIEPPSVDGNTKKTKKRFP